MKIDIHVHTKKIKSGDASTRSIARDTFVEIIKETDVKILAITNHNHFDIKQFEDFTEGIGTSCQIWPGVELDILENGKRGHLIVICNPNDYKQFDKNLSEIFNGTNPDTFSISIKETVGKFGVLDCIYIVHYHAKKPNLGDEEIKVLVDSVSNPRRILKEATNSISAGIYISHGHNSIYGSDIQDWADYITQSKLLPELRLPVESFEQFCLLLEKDEATINTLLNKKTKENIEIVPFKNVAEIIRIDIYNDINILFGSKGTGKTDILEALSKHFNGKGYKTNVYKSNDTHLDDFCDIKASKLDCNVSEFGIKECQAEIRLLRTAVEVEITSLINYHSHFSVEETNKISRKLLVKNIPKEDDGQSLRRFDDVKLILDTFQEFDLYLQESKDLHQYVNQTLLDELSNLLKQILTQLISETEDRFFASKSIVFLNHIVSTFIAEIAKKTGQPQKPIKTGFAEYARNRIKIELAAKEIIVNANKKINSIAEYIGSLGEKGDLYCQTNIAIQNGSLTDSNFSVVKNVKKSTQKDFIKAVSSVSKHIFSTDLFEKIAALNAIESIDAITNLSDLLQKYRHFNLDGEIYKPSNGESSMILLHKELKEDKDIYLIDEPEKSLGNDYINDVIVPLLKEKALLGKKVIIATHDANIAVRTLPYNSIYRIREKGMGYTLTGNPFSNSLKCIFASRPELNWKETSMKTLEGGRDAFGERGKIYGN